jgi:nicotinamide riboside kinase
MSLQAQVDGNRRSLASIGLRLTTVDELGTDPWPRSAKIAFIGSHGVRKTAAVASFAATLSRAGRSWELVKEVVRHSPLGINESATPEAQLWVLVTQVQQELELAPRADVLITDRSVVDNYAYLLRAAGGRDPFSVEPLLHRWAPTYDLLVRLLPDVTLRPDGVRSTNDAFRDEIEAILDARLPGFVEADRLITLPASAVTRRFDWRPVAQRLADAVGGTLLAEDGA